MWIELLGALLALVAFVTLPFLGIVAAAVLVGFLDRFFQAGSRV